MPRQGRRNSGPLSLREDEQGVLAAPRSSRSRRRSAPTRQSISTIEIGEVARAGAAGEVVVRQMWESAVASAAHRQRTGPLPDAAMKSTVRRGQFAVDAAAQPPGRRRAVPAPARRGALHHVGHRHDRRIVARRAGEHAFVGGARDAVPFVEAALMGQPARPVAEMPLAEAGGRIALRPADELRRA